MHVSLEDELPIKLGTHSATAEHALGPALVDAASRPHASYRWLGQRSVEKSTIGMVVGMTTQTFALTPRSNTNPKFLPMLFPFGVVVRFRAVFTEHAGSSIRIRWASVDYACHVVHAREFRDVVFEYVGFEHNS